MKKKIQLLAYRTIILLLGFLFIFFLFCLPKTLFEKPNSSVAYDRKGELLSAIIAKDGQWRFPARDSIPTKYAKALIAYEDEHFYSHNGVYLPSVLRALYQNSTRKKVVSGASTISMQVIRMSRNNPSRTISEKMFEMIRACRLEWRYSKEEILALYASNAPYGGNVVGLDAASWRYFGRTPDQLTWAEAATLAVLPNAPSLIFPGKNQELLREKRNRLLAKLHLEGTIDSITLELSYLEPLPQKPFPLPQEAIHLLNTLCKQNGFGHRFQTSIDTDLQLQAKRILSRHIAEMSGNEIHNAAILIANVNTGEVISYIGNAEDAKNRYGNMVDIVQARRSTGSILKPFLYAAMLHDGRLLPNTLMPDIPIQYDGFAPKNYSETFDGAVPAAQALSRSLNVPAVEMLKDYSYSRFYYLLKKINFSHLNQSADHYGLALILGGAEASLWDITNAYVGMSRTLGDFNDDPIYYSDAYSSMHFSMEQPNERSKEYFPPFDAGSIWCTYKSLIEVNRPESELGWESYYSGNSVAWKTGTSFGNRDAWAVGTTPEYVVGVWVGNADGQGRPNLTGTGAAAPILFDIFNLLPPHSWFDIPYEELDKIAVCHDSGMRIGANCPQADSVYVPRAGLNTLACGYHQKIFLNDQGQRITADCSNGISMQDAIYFVLPPVQEYFYTNHHPNYKLIPPFAEGCNPNDRSPIGLIYPKSDARIIIPKNLEGKFEKPVLKATHHEPGATLYWHLDGTYLGETRAFHDMPVQPSSGKHLLTIVDQNGAMLEKIIEFIDK